MRLSADILIDRDRIDERVAAIAAAVAADTPEGRPLSVLALMDGAFMFCAALVRRLPMPVPLALAPVTSVLRGGDPSAIQLPADFPVRDADVLVVEDIYDTGQTLAALLRHLDALGAARVRLAVLLEKPARREVDLEIDYLGFRVPDRWVVGYGMDADGLYRNLPYVTYVE
jgi:hypoxanthine phosphoribosyltransferase